jgi:hypothetical protein
MKEARSDPPDSVIHNVHRVLKESVAVLVAHWRPRP